MTNRKRFSKSLRKCLAYAAPLVLIACSRDAPQRGEIFIEAVPTASSLFASEAYGSNKVAARPIHLTFDESAYFVSPTSSLLYRGDYMSYSRDQGHLKAGSVLVHSRTASWHGPLLVLPPLDTGRPYSATVWIKLIDTDQAANIKMMLTRVADGAVTNLVLSEVEAEPRTWLKLDGEFIGSAQTDSDINALSLDIDKPDLKYLIDDVMVSYAELSEELQAAALAAKVKVRDLITNGDVELGLEPWSHQGGVISRSSTRAHSGTHSLLIAGRKQEWNAPSWQ